MRRARTASARRIVDIRETRGRLIAVQQGLPLPFAPRRCIAIMDVPRNEIRGKHAHRRLKQYLLCVRGSVMVRTDDGRARRRVRLKGPAKGLYIPPMVWAEQSAYSADAVLLVFASEKYDPRDYIRDYEDFRRRVAARGKKRR